MLDRSNLVSQAQALTTGTIVSTDTVDLSVARDIGAGAPLHAFFQVVSAFATLTSVDFQIIVSANANLSTPTVLEATGAIPVAQLTLGAVFDLTTSNTPPAINLGQRYLGMRYVIVGTGTGSVTAGFVMPGGVRARRPTYPSAWGIA